MAHALFPWEPEPDDPSEDPRDIAWIKVGRRTARGELEWVPRPFAADEIGDLDDVHERWGGGCYTFVARNQRNSAISARANDVLLPGPSKPLFDERAATEPTPPTTSVAAPESPVAGVLTQIAAFSAAVGPLLTPVLEHLATSRREHQALMLELIGRSRSDQDGAARAAIEAAQSNQRVMADFFAKLAPSGGGGTSLEQLMSAVQLGVQLAGEKTAGEDDVMESVMAMFGPLIQAQAQGAPVAAQLPPPGETEAVQVEATE